MIIKHREFPNYKKYEMTLAGRPLKLEVGKLAELANASVLRRHRGALHRGRQPPSQGGHRLLPPQRGV